MPRPSDLPTEVKREFALLRADRRRGAHSLADAALGILGSLLESWATSPEKLSRSAALQIARTVGRAQPAMGPFRRWAGDWRRIARTSPSQVRFRTARIWLLREKRRLAGEVPRLTRVARQRFPVGVQKVVTLSRSESVLRALASVRRARRPVHVTVLESLPGGEGRRLARELRAVGVDAHVVPDRQGPEVVRSADLLLFGADAVLPDGAVVHKVGTRPLAISARRARVPVIVVAGSSKFAGSAGRRPRLSALFDVTPGGCITEYWTDQGVRRGRGTSSRARRSPVA